MKKFRELFWNYSDVIMSYICLILCFGLVQVLNTFNDIAYIDKWVFGLRFTLFIFAYLNTVKLFLIKNDVI